MGFSVCWKCKTEFWMSSDLESAARRDQKIAVYCAHGHAGYFAPGPTEADKLRLERDWLKQSIAQKDDEIREQRQMREAAERRTSAARGQITKIKNRVGNGVCPCCTRSFENLQRHMRSKHPDYSTNETPETMQ